MPLSAGSLASLLKTSASEWVSDKAPRLSAALAYYTVFSLAPLLIIVLAILGFFWAGQDGGAQARLMQQISGAVGPEGADAVRSILENANRPGSNSGVLGTIVGVVLLLFGATGVFVQLQDALNDVWEVQRRSDYGLKGLIVSRILSFGMILVIGFLLLVSLVLSVVLSTLTSFISDVGPGGEVIAQIVDFVVSVGVITLLFAFIYKVLPDVEIEWGDVWTGALVTAVLFAIGKILIGLYLGHSSTASTYGAAGSLVVLLLWIYYSAMILFFGAEITQVYAREHGSGIQPSEHAERTPDATKGVDPPSTQPVGALAPPRQQHPALPQRSVQPRSAPAPSLASRLVPLVAGVVLGRLTKRRKKVIVRRKRR
jgi:membrane protein